MWQTVAAATSEVDGSMMWYAPKLVDRLVVVFSEYWASQEPQRTRVNGASLIVSNTIKLTVFARRRR